MDFFSVCATLVRLDALELGGLELLGCPLGVRNAGKHEGRKPNRQCTDHKAFLSVAIAPTSLESVKAD